MPDTIDTLSVRWDADIQPIQAELKKLNKLFADNVDSMVVKNKAGMSQLESDSKSAFGNIGAALEAVFDRARFGALEEGSAKIGVFGSALEHLGPAGLLAGAGIAAFALSAETATKAMEWAENLENTAKKLGITTTALQELNFVALKSGVSSETVAEGIQKISQAVGAYTSNVKDTRVKSIFEAIGISKDDARNFQGPVDGLEKIADAIAKVQDRSQQLSLLKQLKVPDDMVPLLLEGGDHIREMSAEAKDLGVVMDASTVKKAAELAEKLKEANSIISTQMNQAFVNMAPAVVAIANAMAALASSAANAVESMKTLGQANPQMNWSDHHLSDDQKEAKRVMDINAGSKKNASDPQMWGKEGLLQAGWDTQASASYDNAKTQYDADGKEIARRAKSPENNPPPPPPAHALVAEKPGKAGPTDETKNYDSSAKEALDAANKAVAEASKNLASSLEAKAAFEKEAITDDTDAKIAKLGQEEAKIRQAKVDAHKDAQIKIIEEAKTQLLIAEAAKKELIDRQTNAALIQQQQAVASQTSSMAQAQLSRQEAHVKALGDLATSTADRDAYQRQALAIQQQREKLQADAEVELAASTLAEALARHDSADQIKLDMLKLSAAVDAKNALPTSQADASNAQAEAQKRSNNPLYDYANPVGSSINKDLQSVEVKGLQGLNSGITDAIMHTKSLGDAFHEVSLQIISDLVSIAVKQMITQPLANMLFGSQGTSIAGAATPSGGMLGSLFGSFGHMFGFQAGTDSAPGGLSMVGENGPELAYLPRGTQIGSNNLLRNAMGAPAGAGAAPQTNYNLTTVVQADNSVMTSTIQQWIAMAHNSAISTAVKASSQQSAMSRRDTLIR